MLGARAVGSLYSVTFSGTGGTGTGYSYSEVGGLDGLTFNNGTGTLSGTPLATGSFPFTVTVKDSSGATDTVNYTLTVNPAIVIAPASPLQAGTAGSVYIQSVPFSATGGTNTFTSPYLSESGKIPGLGFNAGPGDFSGTPTTPGTYTFTITATDSGGAKATKTYTITIFPAVTISPAALKTGTQTIAYNQVLTAGGGNGSAFVFAGPGTVDGLTFTDNGNGTATISGTPTSAGSFPYTVSVSNGNGGTATQNYTLTVNKPLSLSTNPSPLPWAAANGPYNATITATGGSGTGYTFVLTAGSLPPMLLLAANGKITGTVPTLPSYGGYTFTVKATDSVGTIGQQTYTITVEPPIAIAPTNLPVGTIGNTYVQPVALTASSASPGPKLTGEIGTPPAGLVFNPGLGKFTGTPLQYGTFPITVQATDNNGGIGTQAYNLVINFTLGNSPADKFVESVYQKLLNHPAGPSSQYWVNLLNAGVSPSSIVKSVEGTTEYLTDVVSSIYQHYLNRALDPVGAAMWVNALASGQSIQSVTAHILSSQEFYNKAGGTDVAFIQALYQKILGRPADPAGLAAWLNFLEAGIVRNGGSGSSAAVLQARYQVALGLLTSPEYYRDLVGSGGIWNGSLPVYPWAGYYNEFLNRAVDPSGLAGWVSGLLAGMSEQSILASIFGSGEGYRVNS